MGELNPRQEAFCVAYATSGNAAEAYRQAGYNTKSENVTTAGSSRLLANVKVRARIREISRELKTKRIMDASEMQERLTAIARQEATEVALTPDGEVERKADFKAALKAMELLGRMQGSFLERRDISIQGAIPVVLTDNVRE